MRNDSRNQWSMSTDVVVVGYGLAGAVTAITAHDNGAEVMILEKQSAASHFTNSTMSGGVIIVPADIDGAIQYMQFINRAFGGQSWTDNEIVMAWAKYAVENRAWFENLGANLELMSPIGEHRDVPGANSIHLYWFAGMGVKLMRFMHSEIERRGIPILYETPAEKILINQQREVTGIDAIQKNGDEGRVITIQSSKAVVLTCGGFEFNEDMKLNYLPVYPTHFTGSPANTGDGIKMAMDVGADLWHMNCCSAGMVAKFPGIPTAVFIELGGQGWLARVNGADDSPEAAGYIIVNRQGKRFFNENLIGTKIHCAYYELTLYDSQRLEYPRLPAYWIFDQNRMQSGQLALLAAGSSGPQQLYNWSKDNKRELEHGWLVSAKTIEELAPKLGIDSHTLKNTVDEYNQNCQDGEDPNFGREARDLVPLSSPPYYSVEMWPGGPNTQGGPRRNQRAQVLDTSGTPIPRLYAAGELGSIFGMIYPAGGGNLSECISFGRIAGENAVKEEALQS